MKRRASQVDSKCPIIGAFQRCGTGLERRLAVAAAVSQVFRQIQSDAVLRCVSSGQALVGEAFGVASGTDRERDRDVSVGRGNRIKKKLAIIRIAKRRDQTRGTAR